MSHKKVHLEFGNIQNPVPFKKEFLPKWKQVHGNVVTEVIEQGQNIGECDGVYTQNVNTPIAVVSADCVPILLARNDSSAISALHAGWRGTYAQIVKTLSEKIIESGDHPRNWSAYIGPSIQVCCYEVSPELIHDFKSRFKQHDTALFIKRERYLDLVALNTLELALYGFSKIENKSRCTFCTTGPNKEPIFHSFRREKKSVRQYSIIEISSE